MYKRIFFISVALVFGLALAFVCIPIAEHAIAAPLPQLDQANIPDQPEWGGTWQFGPVSDFAFTRFDGEYYPGTGLVYFLGGRLTSGATPDTDGSIWSFDPVTGIYADTGVDMPVPISNYKVNLLQDSNGWGLYVFCGRPTGGGITDVVQVYYPDTNTVAQLPAADDYPGTGTCTSGLNVVYNNLAYLAGGFDPNETPPNWGETWTFDPMAASGSRWSQIASATLTTARAYIMGAVVDDMIYAIGGNYFDGTNLINVSTVEVLDPNAATPTWSDAAAADLPEVCSESRAYGFDSDSPYNDPDGSSFAGKIVTGCGTWPDENEHVLVYDTAFNFWDNFPYLNGIRRDHAAAFLPEISGGITGVPGLWIWGGIQGGDTNVLTESEYYAVISGTVVIPTMDLIPPIQADSGIAGATIPYTLTIVNDLGFTDTFTIAYESSWVISTAISVGPVPDGETESFLVEVTIPSDGNCYEEDTAIITATAASNPVYAEGAEIATSIDPAGNGDLTGTIYDSNTSLEIPNAYISLEAGDEFYETFANLNGAYTFTNRPACTYAALISAEGYEFEYPGPNLEIEAGTTVIEDIYLNAPLMDWSDDEIMAELFAGDMMTYTMTISNSGSSDLEFALGSYVEEVLPPIPGATLPAERVDPQILADIAASADGETPVIIMMNKQADLSAAYDISDWEARGRYVWNALVQTAELSQGAIRTMLADNNVEYKTFYAVNGLLVQADLELVNTLAAREDVSYLMADKRIPLEMPTYEWPVYGPFQEPTAVEWGVARVNADDVWSTFGVTGDGIVVANIDTGVEWTHSALTNQYRGSAGNHDYNWFMPTTVPECGDGSEPCDNDGHGTHTMGTMIGDDGGTNQVGVAPGAEWIACKGCEYNSCSSIALLTCGDWTLAPTDLAGNNPDPSMRPHIVNNSWGGGGGDFWYGGVVGAWRAAGVFPQFSAGNTGPMCSTTGSPGDYGRSFDAAATNSSDAAASFSARGPADITEILKPDISAPGVAVRSSYPGNSYVSINGTSMASPHVAGVVALVWSADPRLIGDIENTMWLLQQTADPLYTTDTCGGDTDTTHPNHTFGWGMVDALNAVSTTLSGNLSIPWLKILPTGGSIPAGSSMDVQLVIDATDLLSGTYTGTLQLTADEPYNPDIRIPITLDVIQLVEANFTADVTSGVAPLAVQFTDMSAGPVETWLWDFGDTVTSTLPSPTHTYTAAGVYTVTLTVMGGGDTDTLVQEAYIIVSEPVIRDIYLPAINKP